MNGTDLFRLYQHSDNATDTWNVGREAWMEVLKARDYSGFYLVPAPQSPSYEPRLCGLPLRLDRSLPIDRIELRNKDGRILAAIDGVGDDHATA